MAKATTHLVDRTSPKGPGQKFVGRCRLCGKEGLGIDGALLKCDNPKGVSNDDALIKAIEGN